MTKSMVLIGIAVSILPLMSVAPTAAQNCGSGGENCEDWCVGGSCGKPANGRLFDVLPDEQGLLTLEFDLSLDLELTIGSRVTFLKTFDKLGDELLSVTATKLDNEEVQLVLDYKISPGVYGTLPLGLVVDSRFEEWTITRKLGTPAPSIVVHRNLDQYSAYPAMLSGTIDTGFQGALAYSGIVEGWISMTPVVVK